MLILLPYLSYIMIPFINLIIGIVLVGILSFETGLRADFSRILQSDCIQLLPDQVFQPDKGDTKFVKNKVLTWMYIDLDNSSSGHNSYQSFSHNLSGYICIRQRIFQNTTYFYLLPSELDLPPPLPHSIFS